uniref:OSTA protein n=1 Tax=Heligmosomoides polygyrus TaxID=6339 RepID=A0A183FZN8_HELPZ
LLSDLTPTQFVLFIVAGALSVAVLITSALQILNVYKYVSDEKMRSKLYILALLLPVIALLAFVSMISPRSGPLFSSIGVLYILFAMYTVTSLCRFIAGGREKLAASLREDDAQMSLQVPPCCCCMSCLPKAEPSERNLKIVECMTLQGPIVRAILVVINCHFVAENGAEASEFQLQMTELAGVLSLLFTIFGAHATANLTGAHIQKYRFMVFFRCVDDIYNFVMVCESLLLSLLATFLLLPEKCALFDKYPSRQADVGKCPQEKMLPIEHT